MSSRPQHDYKKDLGGKKDSEEKSEMMERKRSKLEKKGERKTCEIYASR